MKCNFVDTPTKKSGVIQISLRVSIREEKCVAINRKHVLSQVLHKKNNAIEK